MRMIKMRIYLGLTPLFAARELLTEYGKAGALRKARANLWAQEFEGPILYWVEVRRHLLAARHGRI